MQAYSVNTDVQAYVTDTHYKGLPLSTQNAPYLASQLDHALATIEGAMTDSNQLIISCLTLHFPDNSTPIVDFCTDEYIHQFLRALQGWSIKVQASRCQSGKIKRRPTIDFVWNKQCPSGRKPEYRVMLLLNPEAYYHQGNCRDQDTLMYRIQMCWGRIIQRNQFVTQQLVKISGSQTTVVGNDIDDLITIFGKASLLCRQTSGNYAHGLYAFGSSR